MQTAFQMDAFQGSGFQIVATVATEERSAGGSRWHPWHLRRESKRPVLSVKRREVARQIDALERHLAEARNVSLETIRLESFTRRRTLPPYAARAVEKALAEQTQQAFRYAELALRRVERDEEDEFAAFLMLLH